MITENVIAKAPHPSKESPLITALAFLVAFLAWPFVLAVITAPDAERREFLEGLSEILRTPN